METKEAPPKNKCPYGHTFGKDTDRFDDCDDCSVWGACMDDELYLKNTPEKKMKKKTPITIDMEETFKQLRLMLNCEKFIITGSQALKKYGLVTKTDDIDIILINPTKETKELLAKSQQDIPATTKAQFDSEMYENHSLLAIFKWNGIKVDVFESDGEPSLHIDGFEYAMLTNIVHAKLEANRLKDWLQLRKLAAIFWTREGMAKWLNDQEKAL